MLKTKYLSFFVAFVLLIALLSTTASAASASVGISSANSVTVGNQIRVTVNISGGEKIGSWRFSMRYDPSFLEYVSGADSGGGGGVNFANVVDSGISSNSWTVTFRARKIGSTSLSISDAQIVGFDSMQNMSCNSASKTINIAAAPTLSGENNLSALSVSSGELTPAFASNTTQYTLSVPYEVASLTVSATPKHNAATVAVSSGDLVVGENTITVTVRAQNGAEKQYSLKVTRQPSELADVTVEHDGNLYEVAYDPVQLTVPAGFTTSNAMLGEKKFLTFLSPGETIQIAYLSTEEQGNWYIFDEETQTFSPFVSVTGRAEPLVILNPPQEAIIPYGYLPTDLSFEEHTISAYGSTDSKKQNVYLVYGMAPDGSCGFYWFFGETGSVVPYFEETVKNPDSENAEKQVITLQKSLDSVKKEVDFWEILALSLGLLSSLLFIGLILSLILRKKKKAVDSETPVSVPTPPVTSDIPVNAEKRRAKREIKDLSFPRDELDPLEPSPDILCEDVEEEASSQSETENSTPQEHQ